MSPIIPGLTGLLLLFTSAHGDEVRHANAHTHGVGEAILTLQGQTLSLQMSAPLANFAGRSDSGDASESGIDNLAADLVLDLPESARCEINALSAEREGDEADHHHEDAEHDHDEDAHHHEDDEHTTDDDHSDHSGHTDIMLTLVANCAKPDKIKDIDFSLFDTWSGFITLKTTFLTETGATAKSLTKSSSSITRP